MNSNFSPNPQSWQYSINIMGYMWLISELLKVLFPSHQLLKLFTKYYRHLNTDKLNYCKWELQKLSSGSWVRSKMPDKIRWGHVTSSLALLPSPNPSPRKLFITIPLNHLSETANPTPLPFDEKKLAITFSHLPSQKGCESHLKVPELALSSRLAH